MADNPVDHFLIIRPSALPRPLRPPSPSRALPRAIPTPLSHPRPLGPFLVPSLPLFPILALSCPSWGHLFPSSSSQAHLFVPGPGECLLRGPSALRAPSRLSLRSSHPFTRPWAATGPPEQTFSRPPPHPSSFTLTPLLSSLLKAFLPVSPLEPDETHHFIRLTNSRLPATTLSGPSRGYLQSRYLASRTNPASSFDSRSATCFLSLSLIADRCPHQYIVGVSAIT